MIMAGDFRKGVTVEIDGQVWSVVDFQHVKPGKGAAFVRTRLKNVMTGAVLERTFSPTDKYPTAHIETKEMQYLYNDGDLYYFCLLYTSFIDIFDTEFGEGQDAVQLKQIAIPIIQRDYAQAVSYTHLDVYKRQEY